MNIEAYRTYCLSKKGTSEDFPFDEHTLVFRVMGKIFSICGLERQPSQVNLKCDPERAIALREEYDGSIIPGYHMNKQHWNTVILEDIPPDLIKDLVDHSYDLIVSKMTKKLRAELDNI